MHGCLFVHVPWTKFVEIRGALHLQSCTLPAEIDSGAVHERGVWLVRLCAPTCSFFLFNYSHETKETRTRRGAATKQTKTSNTQQQCNCKATCWIVSHQPNQSQTTERPLLASPRPRVF